MQYVQTNRVGLHQPNHIFKSCPTIFADLCWEIFMVNVYNPPKLNSYPLKNVGRHSFPFVKSVMVFSMFFHTFFGSYGGGRRVSQGFSPRLFIEGAANE